MNAAQLQAVADLLGHRLSEQTQPLFLEALRKVSLALNVDEGRAAMMACEGHPIAYRELVSTVTINETYFFRHPEHFDYVARIASTAQAVGTPLRYAWSVGCATGEEAFSLAAALSPFAPELKVAGSDVAQEALEIARLARYGSWSFRDRGPDRIPGLRQVGGQWEIGPKLRALVTFHEQNFAQDPLLPPVPMPERVDVIFCRNVLLYLKPARAAAVRRWLSDCLTEGGVLLLGALEGPSVAPEGFEMSNEANACVLRRVRPLRAKPLPSVPRPSAGPQAPASRPPLPPAQPAPYAVRRRLEEAKELADRGQFEGALGLLKPHHPEPEALFLSGTIHAERGELARAEVLLRQVLLLRPDFIPAHLHLALITLRSGDLSGTAHYRASLFRLLHARSDEEDVGMDGMKVAYIRQVLAGLPQGGA